MSYTTKTDKDMRIDEFCVMMSKAFNYVSCDIKDAAKQLDVFKLNENFLRYSEPIPDKKAIKEALKAGETVEGAKLVESVSMTVK